MCRCSLKKSIIIHNAGQSRMFWDLQSIVRAGYFTVLFFLKKTQKEFYKRFRKITKLYLFPYRFIKLMFILFHWHYRSLLFTLILDLWNNVLGFSCCSQQKQTNGINLQFSSQRDLRVRLITSYSILKYWINAYITFILIK